MANTYSFEDFGSIDRLTASERPMPHIGATQVLVKVLAASLNFRDLMIARGVYPGALPTPLVPLSDAVGEIVEVGPEGSRFKKGDRVLFNFFQKWISGPLQPAYMSSDIGGRVDGVLSTYVAAPEDALVRCPDYLSTAQAAGVGCASLTAWSSLMMGSGLVAGQTVLVQGTGGVSIFALQFAKAMGARVIALTSSEKKSQRLLALGADVVINYKSIPEWDKEVRKVTHGLGVDRVVEVAGPPTFERSVRSLAFNGRICLVGLVGGMEGAISPLSLLGPATSIHSINVGSREQFEASLVAMDTVKLMPIIEDRRFAFGEAREAYQYLAEQRHFGKVVIAVSSTQLD